MTASFVRFFHLALSTNLLYTRSNVTRKAVSHGGLFENDEKSHAANAKKKLKRQHTGRRSEGVE